MNIKPNRIRSATVDGAAIEPKMRMHGMQGESTTKDATLKEKAIEEFKAYCITALYLSVFFGAFTLYRRLILAESGVSYLHYGIALAEALIIAKVVLIGEMLGVSKRLDEKPLVVPVIYKSVLFGVFVLLFGVVEHVVEALVRGKDIASGLRDLAALGMDELLARVIVLTVAFIPFFAFSEIGRVLGRRKLSGFFFSSRQTVCTPQ